MLTALEFINVEQLHQKNSALLPFHLSSAIPDHILNRIAITHNPCLNKKGHCRLFYYDFKFIKSLNLALTS